MYEAHINEKKENIKTEEPFVNFLTNQKITKLILIIILIIFFLVIIYLVISIIKILKMIIIFLTTRIMIITIIISIIIIYKKIFHQVQKIKIHIFLIQIKKN